MRRPTPHCFHAAIALTIGSLIAVQAGQAAAPEFGRDVVPALTKSGCNAGSCHGSFQGRGGFRLSLLGYDPLSDYRSLTRQGRGRRINSASPEHSLLLRKATLAVAHGGGRRLAGNSREYHILRDWIAAGLPGPSDSDAVIERIDVTPQTLHFAPRQQTRLRVRARWSDGVERDVTAWALFDASVPDVASVSDKGMITGHGPGQSAVTVRYLGQVAAVVVTIPYSKSETNAQLPRPQNFIDKHATATWKRLNVRPAPQSDDAEFLRRVNLDLIGTLPTPRETRRFFESNDPNKRAKVIDTLLERPEYVAYWSLRWSDQLRATQTSLGDKGLASFRGWLKSALRENRPASEIVRELLTAQGNLYSNGAVAYYFVDREPADLAQSTAQLFLGIRLQCARCHHHPFERWGQEDYYGLAAFFASVQRKDSKDQGKFGGVQAVTVAATGTVSHPKTGQALSPKLLGGRVLHRVAGDPRQHLADWIVDRKNAFFARNMVNRYWAALTGRGLVHPVDDMRATNPPSHPELLDALAQDFINSGYDVKHLLRTICNSRTYQLAAEIAPSRDVDGRFLTHRVPRRMPAEVLLDAVNFAAGVTEGFRDLPGSIRAIELDGPSVRSVFLDIFGRPQRTSACACERESKPDLRQTLRLANGESIHKKVTHKKGRIAEMFSQKLDDKQMLEELYLVTLSRLPRPQERRTAKRLVAEAPSRKEGFEDLLWTLLNTAEFSFSH